MRCMKNNTWAHAVAILLLFLTVTLFALFTVSVKPAYAATCQGTVIGGGACQDVYGLLGGGGGGTIIHRWYKVRLYDGSTLFEQYLWIEVEEVTLGPCPTFCTF